MVESQLAAYGDGLDPTTAHPWLWAVKPHYYAARAEGRAVGIGCGLKNSGIGNGAVFQIVPQRYGIRGIPNLLILKSGAVKEQIVGAVPKAKLVSAIDKALQ